MKNNRLVLRLCLTCFTILPFLGIGQSNYGIAFAQKVRRDADICFIHIDGSGFNKITDVNAADSGPSYSWDGHRIVFHSERRGWWKIWMMDADGSNIKQVSHPPSSADYDPTFSPDGRYIAFTSGRTGNEDIFILSVKGGTAKNITDRAGSQRYPRWLPDGRIVYYSDESGRSQVYTMNRDGSATKRIDLGPGNNYMADVSIHGKIVFTSDRDGSDDLYIADLDGTTVKKVTESNDLIDYRAKWSPDGKMIAFERSNRTNHSHIWILHVDDRKARQITKSGYNYGPTWKPK